MSRKRLLKIALVASVLALVNILSPKAHALSGSDFNPGRIIDDSVFFNKDAMSVNDIQNFLYAKSGPCDTNRPTTNANYQPPWTCLYQYRENTTTKENNIGRPTVNPSGSITGAQIIYDAAQQYNISPKALIVLIQKESSLITDNWPWSNQYRTATGYGCPDTAPCDAQYYGFYNQVNKAAFQFRRYATYPNEYNYKAGRNNNIGYHPNGACGAQTVYIQNQATAGLYNYTPYVPNAAALNNLYGTGDGCSSYGNRNFWRLYNDWFGSTAAAPYQWQITSQQYGGGDTTLNVGEKEILTVTAKNTGTATWYNSGSNPIRVATVDPQNRMSSFYDASWVSPSRPATMQQSQVAPGETATFSFTVQAPSAGTYNERLSLVVENQAWLNDPGMYFYLDVRNPSVGTQLISQSIPTSFEPNQTKAVRLIYKNNSNITWYKDGKYPARIGFRTGQAGSFIAPDWINSGRPATFIESSVAPGANATFDLNLKAPATAGTYNLTFEPVIENLAWLGNTVSAGTTVTAVDSQNRNYSGSYSWNIVAQQYAGGDTVVAPGGQETLTVRAKNTGTATWYKDGDYPVRLATVDPRNRGNSTFYYNTWAAPARPAALQETSVAPGGTGTFTFTVQAAQGGTFQERFSLVAENLAWFNDPGMYFYIEVK